MDLYTGTSGWSYSEWKGKFYPAKFSTGRMLPFYGEHFRAVEVNSTFRSRPAVAQLEGWAEQVPIRPQGAGAIDAQANAAKRGLGVGAVVGCTWSARGPFKRLSSWSRRCSSCS